MGKNVSEWASAREEREATGLASMGAGNLRGGRHFLHYSALQPPDPHFMVSKLQLRTMAARAQHHSAWKEQSWDSHLKGPGLRELRPLPAPHPPSHQPTHTQPAPGLARFEVGAHAVGPGTQGTQEGACRCDCPPLPWASSCLPGSDLLAPSKPCREEGCCITLFADEEREVASSRPLSQAV